MACRLVLAALVLIVGGCRNRPPQLDPFLGKTTVPAPSTGAIGPTAPGVLSYPAAPPTFTTPPAGASSVPATSPGIFTPNTSAPRPLSSTPPPNNSPPSTVAPPTMINASTPIRVAPPDPNRRLTVGPPTTGGVDIMDLPTRGQGNQPKTAGSSGRLQSYDAPSGSTFNVENAAAQVVTIPGQQPQYGFDASYSRLNGKLEYSSADNRWLLRYVSPENRPDRFGGVVVLVPMGSMNGFRNGDFVTADGRLDATGSASPIFTATAVTLQREMR